MIRWYCESFFTTGDPSKDPCWFWQHSLLRSSISQSCCNYLHGGNVHKHCFLQTTERKRKLCSPSIQQGGVRNTLCTHIQGPFAHIFGRHPPFCAGWVGVGGWSWVVISLNKYQHGHALPALKRYFPPRQRPPLPPRTPQHG